LYGVGDGPGIDVTVADGTGVLVEGAISVAIAVGVGMGTNVEHPAIALTMQIVIAKMRNLFKGHNVISLPILIYSFSFASNLYPYFNEPPNYRLCSLQLA
jgi:hypothetical protein